MHPNILHTYASSKRTTTTTLDAIKQSVYPKSHYRKFRNKLETIKFNFNEPIRSYIQRIDNLVKEANECLQGSGLIHTREKYDLFFASLPEVLQRELSTPDVKNTCDAVAIIERFLFEIIY